MTGFGEGDHWFKTVPKVSKPRVLNPIGYFLVVLATEKVCNFAPASTTSGSQNPRVGWHFEIFVWGTIIFKNQGGLQGVLKRIIEYKNYILF